MKARLFASACAVAVIAVSTPVLAQTTGQEAHKDASMIGEVIVTSTRRPEKLQDVPLSVTAFDQKPKIPFTL